MDSMHLDLRVGSRRCDDTYLFCKHFSAMGSRSKRSLRGYSRPIPRTSRPCCSLQHRNRRARSDCTAFSVVCFLLLTAELCTVHSRLQVQEAAIQAGMSRKEWCNSMSARFQETFDAFDVRYSRFIRTTDADHQQVTLLDSQHSRFLIVLLGRSTLLEEIM